MTDTQSHKDDFLKATFYCVSAHFLFFVMSLGAKYLASIEHHVAEIAFYRNFIAFITVLGFILVTKKTHLFYTKKPVLVLTRASCGGAGILLVFAALHYLPMAYATVLLFTSSILTPVLAYFFLKEHVGMHRWTAVIIGMLGVIVVAQPSGSFSMLGLVLALCGACVHAAMFNVLRALKTENPITTTIYFYLLGFIIPGVFFMPWVAKPIAFDEAWIFLIVALSGGTAQLLIAATYKYAPASFVTPFMYTSLLWNVLADIFFWKYDIDLLAVFIGTALIFSAQIYMIYREQKKKLPPSSGPIE